MLVMLLFSSFCYVLLTFLLSPRHVVTRRWTGLAVFQKTDLELNYYSSWSINTINANHNPVVFIEKFCATRKAWLARTCRFPSQQFLVTTKTIHGSFIPQKCFVVSSLTLHHDGMITLLFRSIDDVRG
jgi:hypothetical protein